MSIKRCLNTFLAGVVIFVLTSTQSHAWGIKRKEHKPSMFEKSQHAEHALLKKNDYDNIKRRDRERDAQTPAKPLLKESIVRRYTQRKRDLQRDILPGEHFTAAVKPGRPLGAATAQKRYGLEKPPKWEGTLRIDKGQPIKNNKALGGQPGYGEGISTKKIPHDNVARIRPMR